jgi:hypothetical protein
MMPLLKARHPKMCLPRNREGFELKSLKKNLSAEIGSHLSPPRASRQKSLDFKNQAKNCQKIKVLLRKDRAANVVHNNILVGGSNLVASSVIIQVAEIMGFPLNLARK